MFKHITTLSCLLILLTTIGCDKKSSETYLAANIKPTDTPSTIDDNNSNDGSKPITKPVVVPDLPNTGSSNNHSDNVRALAQQCSPSNVYAQNSTYQTMVKNEGRSVRFKTFADEQKWLLAYMKDTYIWNDDISEVDYTSPRFNSLSTGSQLINSMQKYLDALKTKQTSKYGKRLDNFSFISSTSLTTAYNREGKLLDSGIVFKVIHPSVPRVVRVAQVNKNTLADEAHVSRGDTLLSITIQNNKHSTTYDINDSDAKLLTESIFYPRKKSIYTYHFRRNNGTAYDFTFTPKWYAENPVTVEKVITTPKAKIGYLVFNNHNINADKALFDSMTFFQQQKVSQMIVDLRYNGGGYLNVTTKLASMLLSAEQEKKPFLKLKYNQNNSKKNTTLNFAEKFCESGGSFCPYGKQLPHLNLDTVYVLTSNQTCSASESLINGLKGAGIKIVTIGSTTCGKPYGFMGQDNCGLSYFITQFYVHNILDQADYVDGIQPTCHVEDNYNYLLGDTNEPMLATALHHLKTGNCLSANNFLDRSVISNRSTFTQYFSSSSQLQSNTQLQNLWSNEASNLLDLQSNMQVENNEIEFPQTKQIAFLE